jgi:hypothetical protein
MALEAVASGVALARENTMGTDPAACRVASNDLVGVSLNKLSSQGYVGMFTIPVGTLTTGITLKMLLTDNGTNANDLGKVVRLGVKVKALTANETTDLDTAAGDEKTVDVTLSSTASGVAVGSLAIANADLDSAAVGGTVAVRIRRIGDHANDTCNGRAILLHVGVLAT